MGQKWNGEQRSEMATILPISHFLLGPDQSTCNNAVTKNQGVSLSGMERGR